MRDKPEYSKLTPTFLKSLLGVQIKLVENHKRTQELIWEMMAGLCVHAPLMRPCNLFDFTLKAVVIEQPTHRLIYHWQDKHKVRAHAEGTLMEEAIIPTPIAVAVRVDQPAPHVPLFHLIVRRDYVGLLPASRCVIEAIAHHPKAK